MSEATKSELKLPKNYRRPSLAVFTGPGHNYKAEQYEGFFEKHEKWLADQLASGELTEERFDEDLRERGLLDQNGNLIDEEMTDADNDGLPDTLHIKSQVRAINNRTLRARHPTRHRFKQYLFGNPSLRLVRKRVLRVSAAQVRANLNELLDKEAAGILSVHAPNGARVDLSALKAGQVVLSQLPPAPPLPNKPLDSVANDTPAGENMPQFVGGSFPGDPLAAKTAERISGEKQEEAEKKQQPPAELGTGADPLEPAGLPAAPEGTPSGSVSTELEQPPMGVDGDVQPVQNQLPQDSEASVEAPPAPEPDPALAATEVVAPPADVVEPPAPEEPAAKTESSSSSKSGKKGSRK